MSKSKRASIVTTLGDHMQESAGGKSILADDRFQGFIPSNSGSGEMEMSRIAEDPDQPRKTFDEEALKLLASNIKIHGVQQPIQLRWSEKLSKWLIVYGHRRYRASKLAGLSTIPCVFISDDVNEPTIRVRQLVENCQREDLAPMELARAIAALASLTNWSNRQIAEELGFTVRTVERYQQLIKLPDEVQQQVVDGELAPTVAIEVLRIKDETQQKETGKEIARQKLNREQAKDVINRVVKPREAEPKLESKPSQLLLQNGHIAIYRNPQTNDAKIQKELMRAASELDPEKAEA